MLALVRDIETRSTVDLGDVGVHCYAMHPTTEVLGVGYCIDDGPIEIWHPGEPLPQAFLTAYSFVAHNAAFEMAIERHILVPKYGFPIISLKRQHCTMAQALAMALPGALEKVARVLKLDNQKDLTGARLMKQLARPRRPRKDEDKNGVYFFEDADRMARNDLYCMQDVATTRELYQRLPPLSPEEHRVWMLDQIINDHGFHLDQELALAARKIAEAANPRINGELTEITNGEVTAITQVAKLLAWIKKYVDTDTLNRKTLDALLDLELPDEVRRALELRLLGAQAAVAKADALLQRRCSDGRIRGSFVYHAAGTGRWASRGAQVHNLKRPLTKDIEQAIEVIGRGSLDHARRHYDNPLSVIGDCIRAMIVAAPGHTLIGGDFSGIEARVLAWLAGEERKLEVFRAFDAGTGYDPYIVTAAIIFNCLSSEVTKDQRQVGKTAELAFGFQGGLGAFRKFSPSIEEGKRAGGGPRSAQGEGERLAKVDELTSGFTDEEVNQIKNAWRRAHPNIVRFWDNLNRAAWKAVRNPGSIVSLGNNLQFICDDSPFLWLTLPSGRKLAYPQMRATKAFFYGGKIVEHERGYPCLLFKDAANGQWRDVKIYGGLLTENIVQATARDLLAEAMLCIDKADFKIVLHVHDECAIEVPANQAARIKPLFTRLMMQVPEWAEGLPVAVNSWCSQRYVK